MKEMIRVEKLGLISEGCCIVCKEFGLGPVEIELGDDDTRDTFTFHICGYHAKQLMDKMGNAIKNNL